MIERLVPSTLRGRLAWTYAGLFVLIIGGLGVVLAVSIRGFYEDRLADQLEQQARILAGAVAPSMQQGAADSQIDAIVEGLGSGLSSRLVVIGGDGRIVADSSTDPVAGPAAVGTSGAGVAGAVRASGDGSLSVSVPVPGVAGAVAQVALPLDEVDAAVRRIQRDVVAAAIAASAIAAVVAVFVAARITGPLDDLRRHALGVAAGRLDAAVTPAATRELGDLARSFNTMTRRVRELVQEGDRSRSRLEAIFANLGDGVVIVDAQANVLGLNAAAAGILGVRSQMSIGQPFVVVARDADLTRLLRAAMETATVQRATIDYARRGLVFDASAQLISGAGELLGIVVVRDVTELRRLELVRKEFVANVSHELRTPLASIRAVVETLEAGAIDDPAVAADFLGRIVAEVDRLAALVDELLDLARLESGRIALKLEAIAPNALIVAGVERLRPQIERARLTLECDIAADLPAVLVDRVRIEQVLLNLVHNAIKFTPAGGTIRVGAEHHGESVQVTVSDTGVGIPENELPRVFERFYKSDKARRSDGTGLGLAIAKHIVQAHHGTISADSRLGAGSTFAFTLPIHRPANGRAALPVARVTSN